MDRSRQISRLNEITKHVQELTRVLYDLRRLAALNPECVEENLITYVRGVLLRYMRMRRMYHRLMTDRV